MPFYGKQTVLDLAVQIQLTAVACGSGVMGLRCVPHPSTCILFSVHPYTVMLFSAALYERHIHVRNFR